MLFIIFGILIVGFIFVQFRQGDNATIPVRIFKQRSIASASWFVFCLGGSFFVLIYYVPIWFQAIKGVTATKSGIMILPMILSLVIVSILSGGAVTVLGYYAPFMIISSVLMAVGVGLMTTWTTHTNHSMWIGYQVIYGLGVGCGMQQPYVPSLPSIRHSSDKFLQSHGCADSSSSRRCPDWHDYHHLLTDSWRRALHLGGAERFHESSHEEPAARAQR